MKKYSSRISKQLIDTVASEHTSVQTAEGSGCGGTSYAIQKTSVKNTEWSEKLIEVVQYFIHNTNPNRALSRLIGLTAAELDTCCCRLMSKNLHTDEYEVSASSTGSAAFGCCYSVLDAIRIQNKPVIIPNALETIEFQHNLNIKKMKFLSIILLPIRDNENNVLNILYLDRHCSNKGSFHHNDLQRMGQISRLFESILMKRKYDEHTDAECDEKPVGVFIGSSKKMQNVYSGIKKIANIDSTVYIHGESGTGKELAVKAIHKLSKRSNKPLIDVNCSAIPKDLAESIFFGHEKGSFTTATSTNIGKFEQADGGILFLDEISELSLGLQAKLLRVIQERQIWRIGGQKAIDVDVRVIVATNKELQNEVRKGHFREDLFYRINVVPLCLPPLRERPEDILPLAHYYFKKNSSSFTGFSPDAIHALQNYPYPGNVRELINIVERAVVYYEGERPLTSDDLFLQKNLNESRPNIETNYLRGKTIDQRLDNLEKRIVMETMNRNKYHKSITAKELGITRQRLDRIITKYHISKDKTTSNVLG